MFWKAPTYLLLLLAVALCDAVGTIQLVPVEQWDFEQPRTAGDNWNCVSCTLDQSTEAHDGLYSARITNRAANWAGIEITADVTPGKRYYFSIYIQLLNQLNGYVNHEVQLRVVPKDASGGQLPLVFIGTFRHEKLCNCFTFLSGDVLVPDNIVAMAFRIFVRETDVDYVVDSAELFEMVDPRPDWRQSADEDIATYRTGTIKIMPRIHPPFEPTDYRVEIDKISDEFAFGSAVREVVFIDTSAEAVNYRNAFLSRFKWAVTENKIKWRQTESVQGVITYSVADEALAILDANGIVTRGHVALYSAQSHNPDWVQTLTGEDLSSAIHTRLQGIVTHFQGRFAHWDVDNEYLDSNFYEAGTGKLNIMPEAFYNMSSLDPQAKLFMNEYGIFSADGPYTQAYITAVQMLLDTGVPIYGIGIQAHVNGGIDIPRFQRRLDDLAALGLPIWITELTVNEPDMATRAQGYEDLLRLFYSHPAVEGVLIWGFWDGAHYDPTAVLAEGPDITLNLAGEKFFNLWDQWATAPITYDILASQDPAFFTGHHGTYEARLYEQGALVVTKEIVLTRGMEARLKIVVKPGKRKIVFKRFFY